MPTGFQTGIQVHTSFFPLAWMMFFCTPRIQINGGQPIARSWGRSFIPVQPGQHTVRVFVPYLFFPECGASDVAISVNEGEVAHVRWFMPPWVFSKGSISWQGKHR